MNAGKHFARITGYGISVAKDPTKSDAVTIRFETENDGGITWYGYLSEKAAPFTIKTLMTCGLALPTDPTEAEKQAITALETIGMKGIDSDLLDTDTRFELVVEEETYNGKTSARIKWINRPNTFEKLANDQMKGRFNGLRLAATLATTPRPTIVPHTPSVKVPF